MKFEFYIYNNVSKSIENKIPQFCKELPNINKVMPFLKPINANKF